MPKGRWRIRKKSLNKRILARIMKRRIHGIQTLDRGEEADNKVRLQELKNSNV